MASGLLNIGNTGVNTSQRHMEVSSNNIANVNSEGYHRQTVNQAAKPTYELGGQYFGTGSYVADIKRIFDKYAMLELRAGLSEQNQSQVIFEQMHYLDETFSLTGKSIPESFNAFYSSLANLADLPSDNTIRTDVMISAEHLAREFNQVQALLTEKFSQVNDQVDAVIDNINRLGLSLSEINNDLLGNSTDMALLDTHDSLIKELSHYIDVSVIETGSGAKDIVVGGTVMLVSGSNAFSLEQVNGDPIIAETELVVNMGSHTNHVKIDNMSGKLAGLFDFRDEELVPIQLELDHLAMGVAHQFNLMQNQGLNLNANVGGNIFADINANYMQRDRISAQSSNAGNAQLTINVTDPTILSASAPEYELRFTNPANYELVNLNTGKTDVLARVNNELLGIDGFDLNIIGNMQIGDSFLIRPASGSAAGINMLLTSPDEVAAASYSISPAPNNVGLINLELKNISNRNDPLFPVKGSELRIEVDSAFNFYQVYDVNNNRVNIGPIMNSTIDVFGFQLGVDVGNGNSIENFTLDFSFGLGDNTNALRMSQINETKLMEGGNATFIDMFENTKLSIGRKLSTADIRHQSAQTVVDFAQKKVDEASSVNLDEEAANLIRYQQSYQASAKVMVVAQQIFETLLDSLR